MKKKTTSSAIKKVAQKAGHKPFASKAQQRLFFANPKLRKWAKAKAHATGESHLLGKVSKARYKALPERKHVVKGRRKA